MNSWIRRLGQNLLRRSATPADRPPRIAVLIDADNVSPKDAERVLEHVPTLGRICILRTYGNFTGRSARAWTETVKRYGAVARHMPSVAPKKNATDIALSIDAVEIMLTRRIDTFVIISSDSDFAPLARRINEEGKDIFGFGNKSTPRSFRDACTTFQEMHTLSPERRPLAPLWSLTPADAEDILLPVLHELWSDGEPVEVAALGQHLANAVPGFDPRIYRRRTLSHLLRELHGIELLERDGKRLVRPATGEIRTG